MACTFIIDEHQIVFGSIKYNTALGNIAGFFFRAFWGKRLYLYGNSVEFGKVYRIQLLNALTGSAMSPHFEDYEVYWSAEHELAYVLITAEKVGTIRDGWFFLSPELTSSI